MTRVVSERVLLIGDPQRRIEAALTQAAPAAQVTSVPTYFDAIAELAADRFSTILAATDPIERRPEAAVRTLRQLAADSRLVLFGHPTLEPLSRRMLEFGCDDYIITPPDPAELQQIFGAPVLRIAPAPERPAASVGEALAAPSAHEHPLLAGLPLAELCLDALADQPHIAAAEAVRRLNDLLAPTMQLLYLPADQPQPPAPPEGRITLSHPVRSASDDFGQLHLLLLPDADANTARHVLSRLCDLIARLQSLQTRHTRLQKLAITDELTGLYNARYFRHFLTRIIERAQLKRFPVTLFIFDIDNFKKYNDQYGHGVGDDILKQTAALMRRACREHDLVARIGGDEFAVVFWEKEGPRQPKEPKPAGSSRTPQTPLDVLERFRRLLSTHQFHGLGPGGKGTLTISGGLAVYPFDARNTRELIDAADNQLVFKAKLAGKNSIFLVGSAQQIPLPDQPKL